MRPIFSRTPTAALASVVNFNSMAAFQMVSERVDVDRFLNVRQFGQGRIGDLIKICARNSADAGVFSA